MLNCHPYQGNSTHNRAPSVRSRVMSPPRSMVWTKPVSSSPLGNKMVISSLGRSRALLRSLDISLPLPSNSAISSPANSGVCHNNPCRRNPLLSSLARSGISSSLRMLSRRNLNMLVISRLCRSNQFSSSRPIRSRLHICNTVHRNPRPNRYLSSKLASSRLLSMPRPTIHSMMPRHTLLSSRPISSSRFGSMLRLNNRMRRSTVPSSLHTPNTAITNHQSIRNSPSIRHMLLSSWEWRRQRRPTFIRNPISRFLPAVAIFPVVSCAPSTSPSLGGPSGRAG